MARTKADGALWAEIAEALSADYTNVYICNPSKGTIVPVKNEALLIKILGLSRGQEQDYGAILDRYINKRTYPADRAALSKVFELKSLTDSIARKSVIQGKYRVVYDDGTCHTMRYTVRRLGSDGLLLMGFSNIDSLESIENMRINELRRLNAEQESRIAEINALNTRLRENEKKLNEAAEEREKQLSRITALNERLTRTNDEMLEANAIIGSLSSEYHTICVIDRDTLRTRLVRVNGKSTLPAAIDLVHKYSDYWEATKRYIGAFIMPEDRKRCYVEMRPDVVFAHTDASREIYSVNYLRRSPDGTVGYHQMAFFDASSGGMRRVIMALRDVDAVVKAEQQSRREISEAKEAAEAANRAKTAFLFNMSHDIRTPMNAILGFAELIQKHINEPERSADYLKKLRDSGSVLLSIINNVLEMSRIENGSLEVEETVCDARAFNDSLHSVLSEMMEQKGISFTRTVNVQHTRVYCDPIKLRQIFLNILSNAYKYTNPGGSVTMRLEEVPSDREGYALFRTSIADTGVGISEEFLPHVFEEFSRESSTTQTGIEGTGLGMPIVKRLTELLGGSIEVRSRKGVGTEFTVTIPHRIAYTDDTAKDETGTDARDGFAGRRLLLAEDNDLNAEIAGEILAEAGFEIERAEDGEKCLEMLKAAPDGYYSLILMDIQMPRMNGYEAARAVRKLEDKEKAAIPILAMTANAFEEDRREAIKSGMNSHVAKPINVAELMSELTRLLKG